MRDVLQDEVAECGLACLATIASHYGMEVALSQLREHFAVGVKGTTLGQLMRYAGELGFAARPVKLELEHVPRLQLPCIIHWNFTHFVVLKSVLPGRRAAFVISDPAQGEQRISLDDMRQYFTGIALEVRPNAAFVRGDFRPVVTLKRLLGPVAGLKKAVVQALGLAACLELLAIGMPMFNQLVLDHAVAERDQDFLGALAIGFALILATQNFIALARGWFLMQWQMTISLQWTTRLFAHLMHIPPAYFQRRQPGDISTNFGSLGAIQRTLSRIMVEGLLDGLMAFAAMALMLFYSARLFCIVLVAMTAYAVLRIALYGPMRDAMAKGLTLHGKETNFFMESLRAIPALQLFGKTHDRIALWQSIGVELQNQDIRKEKLHVAFKIGQNAILGAQGLALFYIGGSQIIEGSLSVGMLVAFTSYAMTFATRVTSLFDLCSDAKMIGVHTTRLNDILQAAPTEPSSGPRSVPVVQRIAFRNIAFRYADSQPWILKDVSLDITAGESIAIVGPSGCGKSTLGKIILGLERPTSGEIFLDDVPLATFGFANFRGIMAAVLQEDVLLAGTVSQNIAFFDFDVCPAKVRSSATLACLDQDIEKMPMGYDTLVGDAGALVSGGQKQRILIARALYMAPQILVLDEASSHLDASLERNINEHLLALNVTKIVVAHRAETIAACDRILELKNGALYPMRNHYAPC